MGTCGLRELHFRQAKNQKREKMRLCACKPAGEHSRVLGGRS